VAAEVKLWILLNKGLREGASSKTQLQYPWMLIYRVKAPSP
jgi:hypothetical protein